jgi:O-antigen/teichoic acid export membrane protein
VVVLGLNLLLIPQLGLLGAAIASLVGVTITNSLRLFQVWFLFRLIPYDRSFIKPILATLVATIISIGLSRWLSNPTGFIFVIIQVAILVAVYGATLRLLGLPPEEQAVVSRVQARVKASLPLPGRAP